jgi:WD40 repeat protein
MKLKRFAVVLLILVGCAPHVAPSAKVGWNPNAFDGGVGPRSHVHATAPEAPSKVWAHAATLSPDGKLLLVQYGWQGRKEPVNFRALRLWDANSGANIKAFTEKEYCVTFLSDSKRVLSRRENQPLRIWEATTGDVLQSFDETSAWVSSLAVSTDGKLGTVRK